MDNLEEEYKRLLAAAYAKLRDDVSYGSLNRDDAIRLHALLKERLGVEDPEGDEIPAWESSTWCGDEGWNNSGCSF
jgi:hypothetical protein